MTLLTRIGTLADASHCGNKMREENLECLFCAESVLYQPENGSVTNWLTVHDFPGNSLAPALLKIGVAVGEGQ